MQTNINNNTGAIDPRYYQIVKDQIGSKQAMEPIAITHGIGPVIGFDVVDTSKNYFSVTGSNNKNLTQAFRTKVSKLNYHRKLGISVGNKLGNVVNAHISPSGILCIDPEYLDFTNIIIDYDNLDLNPFIVVLKAKMIYNDVIPNTIPPSLSDFSATKIDVTDPNAPLGYPTLTSKTNWTDLLALLTSRGLTIDHDTEVIVGIYQFGKTNKELTDNEMFFSTYGNVVPMIPYHYIWPLKADINLVEKQSYKDTAIKVVEHTELIQTLYEPRPTESLLDQAVTFQKLSEDAILKVGKFDYVVTNQAELEALNNLNVSSVYIRKGLDGPWDNFVYEINTSIKLHTNVRRVEMEPGVLVIFNGVDKGFYKDILDYECSYHNLNVKNIYNLNNSTANSCFSKMANLYNCIGFCHRQRTNNTPHSELVKVFNECYNVVNSIAKVTSNIVSDGITNYMLSSFYGCNTLTNCRDNSDLTKTLVDGQTKLTHIGLCKNVSSCKLNATIQCFGVRNCEASLPMSTFASMESNSAYIIADTPEGGFNQIG